MIKKISSKGRLVLPRQLRQQYGITETTRLDIFDNGVGILIRPLRKSPLCSIFLKISKIDGGPVLSLGNRPILPSKDTMLLNEESKEN